jgi:hypothetical protein
MQRIATWLLYTSTKIWFRILRISREAADARYDRTGMENRFFRRGKAWEWRESSRRELKKSAPCRDERLDEILIIGRECKL